MIQCLVEVSSQQTGILGLVELAGANDGSRDGMGSDEVANRCPDEPVVGGDRTVTAIQKEEECLPGVVDAASEVRRSHSSPGQVILQLEANFVGFWQAGLQKQLRKRGLSGRRASGAEACAVCKAARLGGVEDVLLPEACLQQW